jgi:hypothetical protein
MTKSTNSRHVDENDMHNNFPREKMPLYIDVLQLFMKTILEGKYNTIISKIIQDIVSGCTKVSIKLFEDLDKDTCMNIYIFLSNNRSILHLNDTILETMREIVEQKFDNVLMVTFNFTSVSKNTVKLFGLPSLHQVICLIKSLILAGVTPNCFTATNT